MVGRSDRDDIAWQLIELHQQKGHNALDLAGLMGVTALFADGVELIEEKHAWPRADIVE